MFLRSVRLQHWACHDELELALGPGLNLIAGSNGVGKSTLCGAIIAALTIKYSSKDKDVRLLEPWGADGCGPAVSIELQRTDGAFRLSKTYLHDASSRLERLEGDRWTLRHKNRAAEEELARWLDADGAAGRLLLELWSPQSDPTRLFDAPGRNGRLSPASMLGNGLADRLGSAEATGPFALARKSVAEHVGRRFTPVNRQVRVGSDLHHAEAALRRAEAEWDELNRRRDELSRGVEEYRRLEASHRDECSLRNRLDHQAEQRRQALGAYQVRLDAVRNAEEQARQRRETFDRFDRDHRRLLAAAELVSKAEARRSGLEPLLLDARSAFKQADDDLRNADHRRANVVTQLDALAIALDRLNRLDEAQRIHTNRQLDEQQASRRLAEMESAQRAAEAVVNDSRAALRRLEADRETARRQALSAAVQAAESRATEANLRLRQADRHRLRAERDRLDRTLRQVRDRLADRASINSPADDGPVPSSEELRDLRARSAELDARAEVLESDALTLRFEPDRPVVARVEADDRLERPSATIPAGEAIEARGIGGLVLEIEGVGRIRIGRTSGDAGHRLQQFEADRHSLADRLESLGARSVAELEERRRRLDRRSALDAELAALLGGETPDSLEKRRAELDAALQDLGELPSTGPDDLPEQSIDQLRSIAEQASRDLAVARDRLDAAGGLPDTTIDLAPETADHLVDSGRSRLEEAETALRTAVSATESARSRLVEVRARLADARGILADEEGNDPSAANDLRMKISSLRQSLVVWDADPRGETSQAVRLRRQEIEDDLSSKRLLRDERSEALSGLEREHASALADLDNARRRLDEIRLESLDDRPAEQREQRLEELRRDRDRAESQADFLREQLGPDPSAADPDFEARRAEVAERCRLGEQRLAVLLRELELLGADGLDTRLALASEHLDDCKARFESLRRDALAWRLLDRVLDDVEADFARNVARQVEGLSARWVDRLTGRNVRSVALDPESLSPISARQDGDVLEVGRALDRFSRGTREQVALACRLQLGVLLSQDARQMILLDDPLAHTDPGRHLEALEVLIEVSKSLQILIFTCHLDRYARLRERGDARIVSLGDGPGRERSDGVEVPGLLNP